MKHHIYFTFLLLAFFLMPARVKAQIPTFGEVYDFNVGDEFQFTSYISVGSNVSPPNAKRYAISGKYYSAASDTVFYIRTFSNYFSTVANTQPPQLIYTFTTGTDTVIYTNLDSLVSSLYAGFVTDTCNTQKDTLYNSALFCNAAMYENERMVANCFEGKYYRNIYAKGLGHVWNQYDYPAMNQTQQEYLFYYKKGSQVCGTPDTRTAVGLEENRLADHTAVVYPNPASGFLYVSNVQPSTPLRLMDVFGRTVLEARADDHTVMDISSLPGGIYTLAATGPAGQIVRRVIVAD